MSEQLSPDELRDIIIRAHGMASGDFIQSDTEMKRRIAKLLGRAIESDAVMSGILTAVGYSD